jgi:hypothetical protein
MQIMFNKRGYTLYAEQTNKFAITIKLKLKKFIQLYVECRVCREKIKIFFFHFGRFAGLKGIQFMLVIYILSSFESVVYFFVGKSENLKMFKKWINLVVTNVGYFGLR